MKIIEIPEYTTVIKDFRIVTPELDLEKLITECNSIVAVDTETYYDEKLGGIVKVISGAKNNKPFCLTLTVKKQEEYLTYFVPEELIESSAKPFLENESITKIFHNAKFDMHMLQNVGIRVLGRVWDTMIMIHLIDEEHMCRTPNGGMVKSKALKNLGYHYLGDDAHDLEDKVTEVRAILSKQRGCAKSAISYKDVYDACPMLMKDYACNDTSLAYRLFEIFIKEMERQQLMQAYQIDFNATLAVIEMERNGIAVNLDYYSGLDASMTKSICDIDIEIEDLGISNAYNVNSGIDISKMFESLGVKWEWYTEKKAPQTSDTVLDGIICNSENSKAVRLAELILERRELTKIRDTFIAQIIRFTQGDGKLHPDFNVCPREEKKKTVGGTVTGRLSCSNPNLQNIQKDDKRVRKGVVPSAGFFFAELDYSQQEYRLLGAYAADKNFSEIIHQGKDIHTGTAELMLHLSHEEASLKKNRDIGKRINFALVYGLGNPEFARSVGLKIDTALYNRASYLLRTWGYKPWNPYPSLDSLCKTHEVTNEHDIAALRYYFSEEPNKAIAEAVALKDTYFAQFPMIQRFLNACKDRTKARGYCKTWSGRRRHFKKPREEAYKAPNACIQGGCGDITKIKMWECMQYLLPYKSRAVNTIHDAILFEIAYGEEFVIPELKKIMTDLSFQVPFDCTVEVGTTSWAEMEEI